MKIIVDYIQTGRRNRPMTNPASSLYKKIMKPQYITIHNAYSRANAKQLHEYVKSTGAANRPASWHFSIDEKECYQSLPTNEVGWHAGDNLGPGNTTTIGIEICDYAMLARPQNKELFWQAVEHAAKLCAHLIETEPTLKPYPECLKQHHDWSGKNCPSWIRSQKDGWKDFVSMVGHFLNNKPEPEPLPKVQRRIGIRVDDKPVTEEGYLINNGTYVRMAFAMQFAPIKVTGHGDYINIETLDYDLV